MIKVDCAEAILKDIADDIAGLVSFGGTMSVNIALPWIDDEINLIRIAHKKGIPVLGYCFGSQLISKVLDGTIYHHNKNQRNGIACNTIH